MIYNHNFEVYNLITWPENPILISGSDTRWVKNCDFKSLQISYKKMKLVWSWFKFSSARTTSFQPPNPKLDFPVRVLGYKCQTYG